MRACTNKKRTCTALGLRRTRRNDGWGRVQAQSVAGAAAKGHLTRCSSRVAHQNTQGAQHVADAAAIQPHDIEEQACIVDAYEWFAKYCSGIMGLLNHQTWHDLSTVDLVTTLRQTFSEKICEVEVAGTQLIRDLTATAKSLAETGTAPTRSTALRCTGAWGTAMGRAEPSRHSATGQTRSTRMRATPSPASREPCSSKSAASR